MKRATAFMAIRIAVLSLTLSLCAAPMLAVHAVESAAVRSREVAKHLREAWKLSSREQWSREMLGQAEYLAGDFKGAAAALRQLVAAAEKERTKPKEAWQQTLLNSYDRLQDRANADATWQRLLRHYPKPGYWRAVIAVHTAGQPPPPIELGFRRMLDYAKQEAAKRRARLDGLARNAERAAGSPALR
jgi:tetratricopeptide (TPR) repeat protein